MNLLFDTNIILTIIRASDYAGLIHFLNPENAPVYISVASEAEIKSIAIQNNWGVNRCNRLNDFLDQTNIPTWSQVVTTKKQGGAGFRR